MNSARAGKKEGGLGGRNFCPPSLSAASFFAAAIFRASEAGAPPKHILNYNLSRYYRLCKFFCLTDICPL